MKLQSLEIQAFGPFAKKEVINFSALGENPLFLIDGPTGAGKSSILHAICYALYGETTDSDRKELGLRCDHAEADLLTELSLAFSIRGDHYRITRAPTQMRPSKRGGGETEQKSTAHLRRMLESGKEETLVAKKTTEAKAKIEEIVGLSSEQFLQVMVLPQGKFRALLLAKSDDRQAILSTLFQTEIYKRIEQLLKEKAGAIEKQNQAFEDRKAEALSDVHVVDSEALEMAIGEVVGLLEAKQKEKDLAAEKKQQAATAIETAVALGKTFDSRDTKQKELQSFKLKEDEISADKSRVTRAAKAASIAPKWLALQGLLQDIKAKKAEIVTANQAKEKADVRVNAAKEGVKQATEDYQQRDSLKAKEGIFKGYQEQLTRYKELNNALLAANANHKSALDKKSELEEQDKTIGQALIALVAEIESLEQASANKSVIVEQKLLAKGVFEKRKELHVARVDLLSLNQDYQKQKDKFEAAEKVYKKIAEDANRTEMRWFSNQAAVLAEKLEQDMPCAVCGSLKHPNPAVFSENELVINQAVVDQARASQAKQFKVMDAIKEAMQACLHSVTGKEQDVKQLELELADHATKSLLEVEQVYRSLESDLKLIESNEKKLLRAKKQTSDKEQEREPIASDIKAIDDNIPELTALKATAKSELDAANKSLPEAYRNTVAIESVLTQVRQEIKSLETRYEVANQELTDSLNNQSSLVSTLIALNKSLDDLQARNEEQSHLWQQALADSEFATQEAFASAQMKKGALNVLVEHVRAHDDEVKTLQAELGLLERQLKDKQPPDLEKLQQNSNELNDEFTLAESIWAMANQKHKELINTRDKIHKIEKQQVDIKKQYEVVGTLSKAASGRGNVRVTLERFVLGNILDSVLSIASQRLHLMSKGQYRLIRQNEEEQLKNTTAGLDLAIDDAYTGKTRPVATLSGGESFMASLALALGLSDVVQERSGGIQLDTLFIDEGFGSLDQDSLQLAINTLIDLQSAGRAIGIISHVSELKEQMAQRIEVTGSRSGSTIKMLA